MSLGTTAQDTARNYALDACYGDNRSSLFSSVLQLALWDGSPETSGTELGSSGGYARVIIANSSANFPDADGGVKSSGVTFQFPVSTGAYSSSADHWVLLDVLDNILDWGLITDLAGTPTPLTVSAAAIIVRFVATKLSISVT